MKEIYSFNPDMADEEAAVRNFELFHARRPMNEYRSYRGLPPAPDLHELKEGVEQRIKQIAIQQREEWEEL